MVDLQTISLLVQIVGVSATATAAIVGVNSYINSNKRAEEARKRDLETRQAQLFMGLFQVISSKEFATDVEEIVHVWSWKDYDDYNKKYGPTNIENNGKLVGIIFTMSGMGVLVQRKLIDVTLAEDLVGVSTMEVWEKFFPIFLEWRRQFNAPNILLDFEYIYQEFSKIRAAKGLSKTKLSEYH